MITTWAPQETQKTLFELLWTDSVLQGLIQGTPEAPKVYDHIPQNTRFPFIHIEINPWSERGSHELDGWQGTILIGVFMREPGRGKQTVQTIQKRIDELLNRANICIEGWNIVSLLRTTLDVLVEDDDVTYHGIQRFNLLLGEL